MHKKGIIFAAVCIFVIAFVLRWYKLGSIPVSLYWDETAMLLDAKVIAATGQDMHGNHWFTAMFPSYGDYKLPVYIWLASLSVKALGVTAFALRLPSLLAGLGTVLLAGLIAYEMSRRFQTKQIAVVTGLVSAFLMAITPWSILFSRTGFEAHVGQFLLGCSVYSLLKARHHSGFMILAALLGGLATYSYFSIRFVWPVVLVLLWGWNMMQKRDWSKAGWLVLASALYAAVLLPMFYSPHYAASNQFRLSTTSVLNSHDYAIESNQFRDLAGNTRLDRVVFHRHWLLLRELFKNYADNLSFNYLFVTGDPNLRHGTSHHGVLLLITLPLIITGTYILARKQLFLLICLLGWWSIALLPASIPETTPHALRSLNALMPIILIAGFGGTQLLIFWQAQWQLLKGKSIHHRSLKQAGLLLIAAVAGMSILASVLSFSIDYFYVYPGESASEWQDGYTDLVRVVESHKSSIGTFYIAPADDRFYLWLLTFGSYSPAAIQELPTVDYKATKIKQIVFQNIEVARLTSVTEPTMVIQKSSDLLPALAKSQLKPTEVITIQSQDGKHDWFSAAIFRP